MTIVLLIVFVLGGILTALVCKQTRAIAANAAGIAHDAAQDAAGTRHAAEEALRRIADTQPPPAPPTQAIRLPESWAALPVSSRLPNSRVARIAASRRDSSINGGGTGAPVIPDDPATQQIPRIGGTR